MLNYSVAELRMYYNKQLAPIILFVYNRPDHTKLTVEALKNNDLAKDSILYVFADGPKESASLDDIKKIEDVKKILYSIDGFRDVVIEESEKNRGLAKSVISGVTKIINEYGKVIVIEDDIVTHPFFLRFMNECLHVYQERKDVFTIGGFSINIKFPLWYRKDVYATYRSCSWGWATWKDKWEKADWDLSDFENISKDNSFLNKFKRGGHDLFNMLKNQMEGKIDSWAIRWEYTMCVHDGLCIRPVNTLCKNSGFDGSGIHCLNYSKTMHREIYSKNNYDIHLDETIKPNFIISKRVRDFYCPPQYSISKFYMFIRHIIHVSRVAICKFFI